VLDAILEIVLLIATIAKLLRIVEYTCVREVN